MAFIRDSTYRMLNIGDGQIDIQEWNVERLVDQSFEWHSYVGHNYTESAQPSNTTKGAVWLIMRLTDPGSVNETMEYRMGRTGLPGSGNDVLQTEWDARAVNPFFRYDQVLSEFFNG